MSEPLPKKNPAGNEEMSPQFAVFNQHINDAGTKAKAIFITEYGNIAWETFLGDAERTGIMKIFDSPANECTRFYANAVMLFVNKGRTPNDWKDEE